MKSAKLILFFIFILSKSITAQIELPDIEEPDTIQNNNFNLDTVSNVVLLYPVDSVNAIKSTSIFSNLEWLNFQDTIQSTHKKYFIVFSAKWCGPCKMMDNVVFNDSQVKELVSKNYLAKQIDIDDFDGISIAQKYNIVSIPTIIFFDADAKILKRIEGFMYPDMFTKLLDLYK